MSRLVLVSGKGGVGKSAVAAAYAISSKRAGHRVLAIDMAASGSLGAHLGEPDLAFAPRIIEEGLEAMVLDRADALVEYLRVQLGVPAIATIGPAARAFDALASTAPAVREVVTMGKVLWEVKKGTWDVVVADAPPTGQIGSYLRSARTVRELVAAGRILEQVDWMEQLLTDPQRASLVLVTLLEELPAIETRETVAWVTEEALVGDLRVVANRVLPPLGVEVPSGDGPLVEAALLHQSLWAEQEEWESQLELDCTLPFLFGTHTPTEVAEQLADVIGEAL